MANTAYLGGGSMGGSTYDMNLAGATSGGFEQDRGRSRGRDSNPFDETANPSNMSLRGVSPRPIPDRPTTSASAEDNGKADSPTERRSMFRENV